MYLKTFLSFLIIYGLQSNLVICNSSGSLIFQREKMYTSYRVVSTLFLILGVVISSTISYFLNKFVFEKFDFNNISVTVNVLIVCVYNLFVSSFLKKSPNFNNYLYENSFSYAYDVVFTLSVVFMIDKTLSIVNFFISLGAAVISIFVTSMIVGCFVRSCNRSYLNINFRNVSTRLFLMSFFALIFYYLGQMSVQLLLGL